MSKITQQKVISFIENLKMAFRFEKNTWMELIH